MGRRQVGDVRYFKDPRTKKKVPVSRIVEVVRGPRVSGDWGVYDFEAWLEEDCSTQGIHYISFPYYRNGRFAGQTTLRAPPRAVQDLIRQITRRGWLRLAGWPVSRSP